MLLTRKSNHTGSTSSGLVNSLSRGVARAIPTMDRRAFLRRSGMGVGAGLAVSQLTLVQKKAHAADAPAAGASIGLSTPTTLYVCSSWCRARSFGNSMKPCAAVNWSPILRPVAVAAAAPTATSNAARGQ